MSGIYLRQGNGLVALKPRPYEAESVLQELLEQHPQVLAGDDGDTDQGWLLVTRELSIQLGGGGSHGYIDHLFLDADGVPTLVEVKRSSDSRIRREVVGQMLDYAANARGEWDARTRRSLIEERWRREGAEPEEALRAQFPEVENADEYWEKVQTNLAADKLRLVFVADAIPSELRRIVEYLNRRMTETEVLAIEVRQYADEAGAHRLIVPQVLGQSEAAKATKGAASRRNWNRDSVLSLLEDKRGADEANVLARLMDWVDAQPGMVAEYGRGAVDGSFVFGRADRVRAHQFYPVVIYTYGRAEMQFAALAGRVAFRDEERREELRQRLNGIDGVNIPSDAIARRPAFDLALLVPSEAFARFIQVLEWAFAQHDAAVAADSAL